LSAKRSIGLGRTPTVAVACVALGAAGACTVGGNDPSLIPPSGEDGGFADFDANSLLGPGGPLGNLLKPSFGAAQTSSVEPPALSGGTLLVLKDGSHAVAADPDRDAVYVVDLTHGTSKTISLQSGDEPGRLVEDGSGRVHVALRRGGALVTVDPSAATVTTRRSVCPAPRGLTWEEASDLVWVACATGELVGLPASGGSATHSFVVERDLRDVVLASGGLAVTTFRSAEILRLDASGSVTRRDALPAASQGFAAHVAWRAAPGPSGSIYAVHQEQSTTGIVTMMQGGYGSGCGNGPPVFLGTGIFLDAGGSSSSSGGPMPPPDAGDDGGSDGGAVGDGGGDSAPPDSGVPWVPPASCKISAVSAITLPPPSNDGGFPVPPMLPPSCETSGAVRSVLTAVDVQGTPFIQEELIGVLPVDLAVSADGLTVAVALPGDAFTNGLPTVIELTPCASTARLAVTLGGAGSGSQPIAVAFDGSGNLLVQTREPAQLWTVDADGNSKATSLSTVSRRDTGYDVFHTQAGGMIACASCHPEGRDDGHVWLLDNDKRRTPSLAGTIAGTAPYHWPGDMKDMPTLVNDVYTVRMNGAQLTTAQMSAVTQWVQGRPAPPAPSWVDSAASARGKTLFAQSSVGCSSCHSGTKFTDNTTRDVGTGGSFQVPPLVGVGWRTPLMHDGCAATIADRFGACATSKHGTIGALTNGNISDLGAYLESL
jgi:mono/diheme cytochrome c family protein